MYLFTCEEVNYIFQRWAIRNQDNGLQKLKIFKINGLQKFEIISAHGIVISCVQSYEVMSCVSFDPNYYHL